MYCPIDWRARVFELVQIIVPDVFFEIREGTGNFMVVRFQIGNALHDLLSRRPVQFESHESGGCHLDRHDAWLMLCGHAPVMSI